ncbi:MAG: FtsX-like permease family protein, partial [Campylobacterales bacterium]|nr:FtsX-like permease family protein [Campylobacterales bacterium]
VGFASTPLMKRFKTQHTFESGLIAYDKAYIYVDIGDLRRILKLDSFNGIHISSPNPMEDIKEIKEFLKGEYSVVGWWEQNGNFFSALELEKKALFLVLMLIILVASLNIITSLLMTVMNRRREIALLLSLGATKAEVKKIFFIIGSIIGVVGVFVGGIIGGISLWVLKNYEIVSLPADVYGTSKIPIDLSSGDFFAVIIGALIIVIFSSYYPAKKASEVDVLGVLRNE